MSILTPLATAGQVRRRMRAPCPAKFVTFGIAGNRHIKGKIADQQADGALIDHGAAAKESYDS